MTELRSRLSGNLGAEERHQLIVDVLPERAQRQRSTRRSRARRRLGVGRLLGVERLPRGLSDENVRCGGSQIPASPGGRNSSAPGASARRDTDGADAELIGRRQRDLDPRADQAAVCQVVVARVRARRTTASPSASARSVS